ncbi:MAG: molybdopterin cofactor-binding domain-containing protein, partial [Actinomycetota bacterium]
EATLAIERIMDVFAAEIGMDPAELRRRNFLPADAFPVKTPTGADMDTGDYEAALDKVLAAVDVDALRAEQAARRADRARPLLGIGWSAYVEITNPMGAPEFGSCEIRPDGSALLLTGSSAHGQGHYTTFAQLTSELTGIPIDRIEVRHGDTDEVKRGGGTGGSRSLQVGGTAIWEATKTVVEAAKEVAADLLEANPADITLDADRGTFGVTGSPSVSVGWAEVGERAAAAGAPLAAENDFQPPAATFPFGVHLSVVEIDRDIGEVTLVRHVACDDAGIIVNPTIVDGQVHGGVAGGVGQALMEEFIYDEWGNPQTGNFMDYAIPAASEFPSFERIAMETPTDRNPLGVKGIGEAGTIGSTPAVQNAVVDALQHLGVRHIDIPVKPMRVWQAMRAAQQETDRSAP